MTKETISRYLENGCKGHKNVVSSRELERALGISGNELRRKINRLRQEAVPIAADRRGYYYAETAAEVFAANGIQVHIYPKLMPTPSLSFVVRDLGCDGGIVITASSQQKRAHHEEEAHPQPSHAFLLHLHPSCSFANRGSFPVGKH